MNGLTEFLLAPFDIHFFCKPHIALSLESSTQEAVTQLTI